MTGNMRGAMIIKGGVGARIPAAVFEAQQGAEATIAAAQAEAAAIVAAAHAEAERVRQGSAAALAEARRVGHGEGLQAAHGEATELIARALATAARVRARAQREVATVAMRVAEKLLASELAMRPEVVVDVAAAALALARGAGLTLRAHPEDVAALAAARPRLVAALAEPCDVELCADAAVSRGGCVIETEAGTVDARLEVQLAALERALLGDDVGARSGQAGSADE